MMDVMYTIPSDDTIAKCIITRESVEGTEAPIVQYRTESIAEKKVTPKKIAQ